jgi:hypothetical protein
MVDSQSHIMTPISGRERERDGIECYQTAFLFFRINDG